VTAVRFVPLGDLPGGDSYSYASAVSADGSTVVGNSMSATGFDAFKWTEATGMVRLGSFGTNGVTDATSVSGDGKIIVGNTYANVNSYTDSDPFMYSDGAGFSSLSGCGCHGSRTKVTISDDGTTVVGSESNGNAFAYRWTAQTGPVSLGDSPGGNNISQAMDVTPDGKIVVGSGSPPGAKQGFRWTEGTGLLSLGSLMYSANAVSVDGSAIAGIGFQNSQQGAVRWTEQEGPVWLGNLPALQGNPAGFADDISADGSVIVGGSGGDFKFEAFRWTRDSGMLRVKTILEQLGIDMTGWNLQTARAVSADGSVIVGTGTNPQGNSEGWLAIIPSNYVPEPANSVYIAIGLLSMYFRHRNWRPFKTRR
jgi:probable HAF family extracellular repeat protein